jgi:hypothetical protein
MFEVCRPDRPESRLPSLLRSVRAVLAVTALRAEKLSIGHNRQPEGVARANGRIPYVNCRQSHRRRSVNPYDAKKRAADMT